MRILVALLTVVLFASVAPAQQKKGEDPNRSVQGVVTGPDDQAVVGAIVKLTNTKTLQIRSFVTQEGGSYHFQGLSPDIEYQIQASDQKAGTESSSKSLSPFDSRKQATINLKLQAKK
jgi:hypothetical protein